MSIESSDGSIRASSFGFKGSLSGFDSPKRSVFCNIFPVVKIDVRLFHVSFEDIFVSFRLAVPVPLVFFELRVEDLLWETIVHSYNVTVLAESL